MYHDIINIFNFNFIELNKESLFENIFCWSLFSRDISRKYSKIITQANQVHQVVNIQQETVHIKIRLELIDFIFCMSNVHSFIHGN